MAAPGGSSVTGATELRRAFRRLDDRVSDLDPVHEDGARLIEDAASRRVPVLSGSLRASIHVEDTPYGVVVEAGGQSIPYAWVIHFGWRRHSIEPQPFMYDALDERYDEVLRKYDGHVDKQVIRFDREAPK